MQARMALLEAGVAAVWRADAQVRADAEFLDAPMVLVPVERRREVAPLPASAQQRLAERLDRLGPEYQ